MKKKKKQQFSWRPSTAQGAYVRELFHHFGKDLSNFYADDRCRVDYYKEHPPPYSTYNPYKLAQYHDEDLRKQAVAELSLDIREILTQFCIPNLSPLKNKELAEFIKLTYACVDCGSLNYEPLPTPDKHNRHRIRCTNCLLEYSTVSLTHHQFRLKLIEVIRFLV